MKTYEGRIDSDLWGTACVIHKRGDVGGDNYWMRLKINGVKYYIRRSTKTSNAALAMRIAEKEYGDLRLRKENNQSLSKYNVREWYAIWIERTVKTAERKQWIRGVYERYIDEYMGHRLLTELTAEILKGYWQFRLNYWKDEKNKKRIELNDRRLGGLREGETRITRAEARRRRAKSLGSANVAINPTRNTLRAEGGIINEMLRDAAQDGHIVRQIQMRVSDATKSVAFDVQKDSRRATFTRQEWQIIRTNLRNYRDNVGKYKATRLNAMHLAQREMLYVFVMLAASCGARVGELKGLRWRDVKRFNDNGKVLAEIRIRATTSKVRRERTVIAHSDAILGILEHWRANSDFREDGDLIFYSAMHKAKGQKTNDFSATFKTFLKTLGDGKREDGLYKSDDGEARTLYSLRHLYATFRLEEGVSVYSVAQNMGTSVTQIHRHYGHTDTKRLADDLTRNKHEKRGSADALKKLLTMVESGQIDSKLATEAFEMVAGQGKD